MDGRVVIVGGGHGGTQAATVLRQQGFLGSITILSDEDCAPYQRPPLSKDYLAGASPFEKILFRPDALWVDKKIDVRLGAHVTAIAADDHRVTLQTGETVAYDRLIWAAGGEARRLACEGFDLPGVHHVRRRSDVDALAAELPAAHRIAIVGGGYIGLEAASVLTGLGKSVTLLEATDRILSRVAGEPLSRFFERQHADHGVNIRRSTSVRQIVSEGGRATGVMLEDGETVPADIIIVGIGLVPNISALRDAGAVCGNGVDVDELCRTNLPDVYAIGDCAAHPNPFAQGQHIRLESVQNAHDQAMTVAKAICGKPAPYNSIPWFWSSQYDLRLQTIGLSQGHDQAITRGDMNSGSFSIVYLRDGRVIALDCVNAVKDYVQGRSLILAGNRLAPDDLADSRQPLLAAATV